MPAILRNSLPNLFASPVCSQSLDSIGVAVAGAPSALDPVYSPDRRGVVVLSLRECVP